MGNVNSDPLPAELLGSGDSCTATAEWVKYYVAGVAAGLNNAL
jgi:hypothetical protein